MTPAPPRPARRLSRRAALGGVAVLAAITATACSTAPAARTSASSDGKGGTVITVVAAENFWGSIAAQLGGSHVKVTSIIDNPDADPHDYEPTAADARTVAGARLTVVNGIGYDAWADKLLAANPAARPHRPRRRRPRRRSSPAATRTAGTPPPTSTGSSTGSPPTTSGSTPPTPPTSTGCKNTFETHRARPVQPADRRHQGHVRGHARSAPRSPSSARSPTGSG